MRAKVKVFSHKMPSTMIDDKSNFAVAHTNREYLWLLMAFEISLIAYR